MGHQSFTSVNWFNYISFLMADKDQLLREKETIVYGQGGHQITLEAQTFVLLLS